MTDESAFVTSEIQDLIPVYSETDYPALTPEEILFVYKYLAYGNDYGRAYMEVYGAENLTKAKVKAFHILKKATVQDAINRMQESIFQYALHSLPSALLVDINMCRNISLSDIYNSDGTAKSLKDIPLEIQKKLRLKHLVNNKTGGIIVEYDIIGKDNTTEQIIDLLKMRTLSVNTATVTDESAAIKEAREVRNKVLDNFKEESIEK